MSTPVKSLGFWIAVSVIGIILLGVVLSVAFWDWLQGGTNLSGNGDAVRTVALVVGGVVTILLALWRSVVAERQATVAALTYLNERYRQAASMLGDSSLPVRLGGIVALDHLAEDHPDEFQHEAFRLLIEFVRAPPDQQQPNVWDGWLQLERPATRQDVQAAVEVIARLERLPHTGHDRLHFLLNFTGAQLCGVDLRKLRLSRATLESANLMFANLEHMDLTGAQLQMANCRHARFRHADLSGAYLSDADFSGVQARQCKFRRTMMPAKMVGADLAEADLTEAIFPNTDLTGAELREANLTGANLHGWVYWIDWGGMHEAEDDAVQITQEQLDAAVADPERPPTLSVRKGLVWRGKAPSKTRPEPGPGTTERTTARSQETPPT